MRIIAGRFKGRAIKAVAGTGTRPTTDRVREAWASSISSLLPQGFDGLRVLDAFAGSGALGLEALSRGAAFALFCEKDPRALTVLKQNLATLGVGTDNAMPVLVDVLTPGAARRGAQWGPFGLVLIDPPYGLAGKKVGGLLQRLANAGALCEGALVAYEHHKDQGVCLEGLQLGPDGFIARLWMVSCKTYGITQIEYLRYQRD